MPSACGNRVHSCLLCRKHRAFRLRKSCSFVSFVQERIVQEVLSCLPLAEIVSFVSFMQKASCLPLAEIVFIRVFCARESCRKYRVFRLRKSCSFVPFVQEKRARFSEYISHRNTETQRLIFSGTEQEALFDLREPRDSPPTFLLCFHHTFLSPFFILVIAHICYKDDTWHIVFSVRRSLLCVSV